MPKMQQTRSQDSTVGRSVFAVEKEINRALDALKHRSCVREGIAAL